MTVLAFAGPSLPAAERAAFAGVEWRPPAEAGDLLTLDLRPGLTVCLIDGYFDHRPAVRHKELLAALAEGVRILGASSIGALRAAEMAPFGMTGVGAIFRAYAAGRIEGDDEVALVHGPADRDWRPLSIPLVDVRATLCRALRERRVAPDEARRLLTAAREVHYPERCWSAVLAGSGLCEARRTELARALAAGSVPQKRLDALACLAAAARPATPPAQRPARVETIFLRALARSRGTALPPRPPRSPCPAAP